MSKADVLKDIEPVAQMDIWDGEMKIYESMAEYNKQIKRVNVYTDLAGKALGVDLVKVVADD